MKLEDHGRVRLTHCVKPRFLPSGRALRTVYCSDCRSSPSASRLFLTAFPAASTLDLWIPTLSDKNVENLSSPR